MNRHEKRAQKAQNRNTSNGLAAAVNVSPIRLLQENDFLRRQNAELIKQHNMAAKLLQDDDGKSRIDIRVADGVPDMVVSADDHYRKVAALKKRQRDVVRLTYSIGELDKLMQAVDLLAVHCNRTRLKIEIAGYDTKIMAKMQDIEREALEAEYSSSELQEIGQLANLRRVAIMKVNKDNGHELREVVAATSFTFSRQAQTLLDRLKKGITQGRVTEPETKRIAELAYQTKYIEHRKWADVPEAVFKLLLSGSGADQAILQKLQEEVDVEQTIKNTYHGYLGNSQNEGKSVDEIFSQRAIRQIES